MHYDEIILGSVLSEKAYALAESKDKVYMLKVAVKATKEDVKKALKYVYGVDVVKVNTSILRGKVKKRTISKKATPKHIKQANEKRAFVKLKSGQMLPTVNQVDSETEGVVQS